MIKPKKLSYRPGPTETELYSHRSRLEDGNFGFNQKRGCSICIAKTKASLVSPIYILGFLMLRLNVCGV